MLEADVGAADSPPRRVEPRVHGLRQKLGKDVEAVVCHVGASKAHEGLRLRHDGRAVHDQDLPSPHARHCLAPPAVGTRSSVSEASGHELLELLAPLPLAAAAASALCSTLPALSRLKQRRWPRWPCCLGAAGQGSQRRGGNNPGHQPCI